MSFRIESSPISIFTWLLTLCFLMNACGGKDERSAADHSGVDQVPEQNEVRIRKGDFATGDRTYPTFEIGGLVWLGVNLDLATPESWCYDDENSCEERGRLYRWSNAHEACTKLGVGWRLPTEAEWRQLAITLGGYTDWLTEEDHGDPAAANRALLPGGESGFDAPLGGWRGSNGGFDSAGQMGFYWTDTETSEDEAWFYIVLPEGGKLTRRSTNKRMGMACRCVRNLED